MKRLCAFFAIAAALFAGHVAAMDLSPAQRATLRADIQADPVLGQLPPSSDAINQIIAAYAQSASPAYVVWRSALTPDMARAAIVVGAAQMDALTVGKRDTLLYITQGDLNVADANVRAAIDDLCGTQNTLKGALQAAEKRNANRLEKLFATGAGTTASPSTMVIEGTLEYGDVLTAMGW